MKIPSSLTQVALVLAATVVAGCVSHAPRSSTPVESGIASALASSSLDDYTKAGCLSSLNLWSTENKPPVRRHVSSGLFFFGDSYLTYDLEYLIDGDTFPSIAIQSSDSNRQVRISASQASELMQLVSAARNDPSPQLSGNATHTTCAVFLDSAGDYFVVYPDEATGSMRHTDRAIDLLGRINQSAP